MKNSNIPLAIILKRTENGYTFQALEELIPNKDKNKKPKPGKKSAVKGAPNRLIKEIGLSNDQIIQNTLPTPEPQPSQQFEEEIHDNAPVYHQLQEEEEVSCEIERETELPKSPANWFDKAKIHQHEKREMKEFFSGSEYKNPELYMKYRNFIIEAYEINPNRYLSKIACRKILRGDVNTIMRIHSFLEKQCLINFCLNYDGNFTFKSTSLTKPFEKTIKPQTTLKSSPEADEETFEKEIDTDNMTLTVINKNFSRTYRACCNECKLICGVLWFANISEEESAVQKNLCYDCWIKKSEPEKKEYEKVDIVKKMEAHGRDGKNFPKNAWNIEENIKLLDFMSNSEGKKSWKQLLNEFGGKRTIEDIVLQFLQFPISNAEISKSKSKLSKHLSKQNEIQIGSSFEDYVSFTLFQKTILKDFYEQSDYNKKKTKNIREFNEDTMLNGVSELKIERKESHLPLAEMISLAMSKISVQVESLKAQEELIQSKTANYSSSISYQRSKNSGSEEEEEAKETNDLENRSKSLKNLGEKKNESSQFLDDIEGDANFLSEV